jgi:hypothetical protein
LTSTSGLNLASIDIRTVVLSLGRATTLGGLGNHSGKAANAHITLAVTCESILSGEARTTSTCERLIAAVCLEVTFEIMSADEMFLADVALELTVSKVCLDVRLNVLLPPKAAKAVREQTYPLAVLGIRS